MRVGDCLLFNCLSDDSLINNYLNACLNTDVSQDKPQITVVHEETFNNTKPLRSILKKSRVQEDELMEQELTDNHTRKISEVCVCLAVRLLFFYIFLVYYFLFLCFFFF